MRIRVLGRVVEPLTFIGMLAAMLCFTTGMALILAAWALAGVGYAIVSLPLVLWRKARA